MLRRDARLTKYQYQIAQIMFLWLVLGLAEAYLNPMRTSQALLVCLPPFVYYVSHYFLLIKRKWIAEATVWVFLIGTIGMVSISSGKLVKAVDYSSLYIKESHETKIEGMKILVMGDDLQPYLNNKTSSYFLDWKLFQTVFSEPGIYKHVIVVADAFSTDPPEVIMDPENNFSGIIKYIPAIRQRYRRVGNNYIRVP
jgi:hypothetical protein